MPRYFFHIDYGEVTRDTDGTDFPNVVTARAAAVAVVGEMLKDAGDRFWAKPDLTITVTDADDLILWTVSVTGQQAASVSAVRPGGA